MPYLLPSYFSAQTHGSFHNVSKNTGAAGGDHILS